VLVSGCEAGPIDIAQRRGQPRRGPETRRDPRRITRNLRTAFGRHGHELVVLLNQTFDFVAHNLNAQDTQSIGSRRVERLLRDNGHARRPHGQP